MSAKKPKAPKAWTGWAVFGPGGIAPFYGISSTKAWLEQRWALDLAAEHRFVHVEVRPLRPRKKAKP